MKNILFAAVALAGVVAAHPYAAAAATTTSAKTSSTSSKTSSSTCSVATRNANFDDIVVVPAVELQPVPVPYMGLDFQGFDTLEIVESNTTPGIIPHSGIQYAISDSITTTTQGSAEWTTVYTGSTVKSFNATSFYYGCALNLAQGATAVPQACNIAITGFSKGDNTAEAVQVAAQEFSYNPTTATGPQQMTQGVFNSGFKNLQYVLVQYTLPGGSAALAADLALVIDDVIYTTCS